jgi:hypothetical protein
MACVRDHGRGLVDDPDRLAGVTALGMDETAFLRANRRRHTSYVSGLVDTATGRLLDVVEDRTARAVTGWLARRDPGWLAAIGVVSLDPHRGYANAVGAHLGHATLVVDHFHVIKLANTVIDEVRRRVQHDQTGHRGRKGDPLYGIRKLLLTTAGRLDERGWARLAAGLRHGDPDGAGGRRVATHTDHPRPVWRRGRRTCPRHPRPALYLGRHQRHPGTAAVRGHRASLGT